MHLNDETKRPKDIRLFNDVVVKIHLILMKHDMLCYDLSHTAKQTQHRLQTDEFLVILGNVNHRSFCCRSRRCDYSVYNHSHTENRLRTYFKTTPRRLHVDYTFFKFVVGLS